MTFFILTLLFCLSSFGQIRIQNVDLKNRDSSILFRDMVNHIELSGLPDPAKVGIWIQGGMVSYIGKGKYLAMRLTGEEAVISLFAQKKSGAKTVLTSRRFFVQTAGEPSVTLDEEFTDTVSNGQELNRTRLEVKLPNPNYGGQYQVAHFEICLIDPMKNIVLPPTFISGEYLGKEIDDKIQALPVDGIIRFTQVVLTYPDGGFHKYKDFSLRRK
ncbi:MAG: hypothetical protein JWP27_2133 [Flaviaesturariibacter sp.]|nr:hypothetical protein [Flaviaesturariibacter sp.]